MSRVDPSLINPSQIEDLAFNGLSMEEIAACFGVTKPTFANWLKKYPDLDLAHKRGTAKATQIVVSKLMESIANGNVQSMMFYLDRKAGWKQTQDINVNNTNLNEDQIEAMKMKIMDKLALKEEKKLPPPDESKE